MLLIEGPSAVQSAVDGRNEELAKPFELKKSCSMYSQV
jgi:hypothetical protein